MMHITRMHRLPDTGFQRHTASRLWKKRSGTGCNATDNTQAWWLFL